jgi:hypothetical protein
MALASGSDGKLVIPDGCNELLNSGAFSYGTSSFSFQSGVRAVISPALLADHSVISGTFVEIFCRIGWIEIDVGQFRIFPQPHCEVARPPI